MSLKQCLSLYKGKERGHSQDETFRQDSHKQRRITLDLKEPRWLCDMYEQYIRRSSTDSLKSFKSKNAEGQMAALFRRACFQEFEPSHPSHNPNNNPKPSSNFGVLCCRTLPHGWERRCI